MKQQWLTILNETIGYHHNCELTLQLSRFSPASGHTKFTLKMAPTISACVRKPVSVGKRASRLASSPAAQLHRWVQSATPTSLLIVSAVYVTASTCTCNYTVYTVMKLLTLKLHVPKDFSPFLSLSHSFFKRE